MRAALSVWRIARRPFSTHESFVNFDKFAKFGFRPDQSRANFVAHCFGNNGTPHVRHA
jgi:hypothetical protein